MSNVAFGLVMGGIAGFLIAGPAGALVGSGVCGIAGSMKDDEIARYRKEEAVKQVMSSLPRYPTDRQIARALAKVEDEMGVSLKGIDLERIEEFDESDRRWRSIKRFTVEKA